MIFMLHELTDCRILDLVNSVKEPEKFFFKEGKLTLYSNGLCINAKAGVLRGCDYNE